MCSALNPQPSTLSHIFPYSYRISISFAQWWKSESAERALKLDESAGTEQIIFNNIYYIQGFFVHNKGQQYQTKINAELQYKRIMSPSLVLQLFKCLVCTHPTNILIIKSFLYVWCWILGLCSAMVHLLAVGAEFWTKRNVVFRFGWKPTKVQTQIIVHDAVQRYWPSASLHSLASVFYFWLRSLTNADIFFFIPIADSNDFEWERRNIKPVHGIQQYTRCRILFLVRLIQI